MRPQSPRIPRRGEIWFAPLPTDPAGKGLRPIVIVSPDSRNQHPRAATILAVPLSTTLRDPLAPTRLRLQPGESGLSEISEVQAENIAAVRKETLQPSRRPLRNLTETQLRKIARGVAYALGFLPEDLIIH